MSTRLAGKTVLVTRPRSQADELRALLEAHGARVVIQPVIEILPPQDPAELDAALDAVAAKEFDWAVFSSENGVRFTLNRLAAKTSDPALFFEKGGVKLAAVGSHTADVRRSSLRKGASSSRPSVLTRPTFYPNTVYRSRSRPSGSTPTDSSTRSSNAAARKVSRARPFFRFAQAAAAKRFRNA